MRFLVILALVVLLAVAYIRADETKELANKEVVKPVAEPKVGRCTEACALKTLMIDEDNIMKSFLKILVDDEEEDEVDDVLVTCDKGPDTTDDSCEEYFTCIEAEFTNRNISFAFEHLLGSKD